MHEGGDTCENTEHNGMRDPWRRLQEIFAILQGNEIYDTAQPREALTPSGAVRHYEATLSEDTLRKLMQLSEVCPRDMGPAPPHEVLQGSADYYNELWALTNTLFENGNENMRDIAVCAKHHLLDLRLQMLFPGDPRDPQSNHGG